MHIALRKLILNYLQSRSTRQFFDFHTAKLEHVIRIPSSIVSLTLQPDSGLAAIVCDDLIVRMIDLETRRVVREYRGFKGRVLDVVCIPILNEYHRTLDVLQLINSQHES